MDVDKDSDFRTLDPLDTSTLALKGGQGTESSDDGPRYFHFIQHMNLGIIRALYGSQQYFVFVTLYD